MSKHTRLLEYKNVRVFNDSRSMEQPISQNHFWLIPRVVKRIPLVGRVYFHVNTARKQRFNGFPYTVKKVM